MDKQLVALAFAGGIDTKTDEYHVLPTKLLALQNGIFNQTGSVTTRWGYKKLGTAALPGTVLPSFLPSPSSVAAGVAINYFNGELLAYDGQNAFSYDPALDSWAYKGRLVSVIQTNSQVTRNNAQQLSPDCGTLNGTTVFAYESSLGSLNYTVRVAATGKVLVPDGSIINGSNNIRPKVLGFAAAGLIVVLFLHTGPNGVWATTINPNNPTTQYPVVQLLTGLGSSAFYDAQIVGNRLVVAYFSNGATKLTSFDSTLSPVWTVQVDAGGGSPGQIALLGDTARGLTWVLYATSNTSASVKSYDANGNLIAAGTGIITTSATIQSMALVVPTPSDPYSNPATGTTPIRAFVEVQGSAPQNQQVLSYGISASGAVLSVFGSASPIPSGLGLASKPFTYANRWYVNTAFQTQQQPTYFTIDQDGNVVAKVNAGLGGGLISGSDSMLPECIQVSPGVFQYANLVKGIVNTEAGLVLSLLGVNSTTLDFIDSDHFLSAPIMGGLYTVGGIVQSYDGAQYVEHGFHVYPEPISTAVTLSGGHMADGTYNYCVTYEWVDNNGLTQISTPSVAVSAIVSGGGGLASVTLTIPTLRLTKKTSVKIVVYRTTLVGDNLLYRVTSAIVPLYNNVFANTVTFTDTLADASVTSNGLMYTQPLASTATNGNPVLPNAAPPACSLIATYADRVFLGGLDDPYLLWYSQQSIAGAPAQFSAFLTLRMDPDGGGITALFRMDDKLVIFKQNAIFILIGNGPDATGGQNDFTDPVQVPSGGVGCISQSSIVLTPLGLMFDSGNGIYLLDRGLNVSYKGAPVEAYTNPLSGSYAGHIGSATLIPNQWAIFTTADPFGLTLVYDYFYDQWSTFTGTGLVVDSVLEPGTPNLLAYMNADGSVWLQTPGVSSDNGQPVNMSLTTAWCVFTEKQGYQRVYEAFLLGHYKGTHTLNVGVGLNYVPAFTKYVGIPSDSALGLSAFGSSSPFGNEALFGGGSSSVPDQSVYQFRVDVVQKCQAIRFQISVQQSAPGTGALSLASLVMRVGAKRTGYKAIAPSKVFGAT